MLCLTESCHPVCHSLVSFNFAFCPSEEVFTCAYASVAFVVTEVRDDVCLTPEGSAEWWEKSSGVHQ